LKDEIERAPSWRTTSFTRLEGRRIHVVSQCANPACRAPFIYLRNGKLFKIDHREDLASGQGVEFFWLCEVCAGYLMVEFTVDGANIVPRGRMKPYDVVSNGKRPMHSGHLF
jgi:hypothetical protein